MLPVGQQHGLAAAGGRRVIGREHVCQHGCQHEHDNDPYANERGVLAPQLPPGHRLETLPRGDRLGYFDSLLKNDRLAHTLLLSLPAFSSSSHPGIVTVVASLLRRLAMYPLCHTECV